MSSSEQFRPTRGESGCYVLDTAGTQLQVTASHCKYGVCTEGEGSSERSGRTLALRMCGWQTGQQGSRAAGWHGRVYQVLSS
jgi:hypothetical protein